MGAELPPGVLHAAAGFYVSKTAQGFTVWPPGVTHSRSDSAYEDKSVAVARCDYLAKTTKPPY